MRIISGKAKGRKLIPPEGSMITRPTLDRIKEAIYNIIQNRVYDSVVVDVFAGTGSLGLEAASRGAKECYLIDRSDSTFPLLKKNVENLKFEDTCTCCKGDSYEWLRKFADRNKIFDLIFIDPPYAKEMIPEAINIVSEKGLLHEDGIIVCKIDSGEVIFEGNEKIELYDKRKYGNTTVLFYRHKED